MSSRHLRRVLRSALAAAVLLVVAACAAIPTAGPVEQGGAEVDQPSGIDVLPEGPRSGAKPQDIVEGFRIAASDGIRDDFVTARQYLAGEFSEQWEPLAGVVVAGDLEFSVIGGAQVQVDAPVVARVDAEGRLAEYAIGAQATMTFELVQDGSGDWRISRAPDGLIVLDEDFRGQFSQVSLYFLSPDQRVLVPESRWLPTRNLATSAVRALLAGPSPWLQDAVSTAVPAGVQLKPEAVLVDKRTRTAVVGLDPAKMSDVLDADRPLLLAQIEATLLQLPTVGSVQVEVGDAPLKGDAALKPSRAATDGVEFLQGGRLVKLSPSGDVTEVPGIGPLADLDPHSPARNEDGSVRAVLAGRRALVTVPTLDEPSRELLTGTRLLAPSVDRFGWVWTADGTGPLVAVRAGAEPTQVAADWLDGRTIQSVRVAQDGVRVAVVSVGAEGVSVDLAAIYRGGASGAPLQLGEQVRVGAPLTDASTVVWVDESTLAVVGRSTGPVAVHLVPLSGRTESLPELVDLVSLSGGRTLHAATADGSLFRQVALTWTQVPDVDGAADPSTSG